MTQGSDEGNPTAAAPPAGGENAPTPAATPSLADRVDAALASGPQTMLGGVGFVSPAAGEPRSKATAILNASPPSSSASDTGLVAVADVATAATAATPAAVTATMGSATGLAGRVVKGRYLIRRLIGEGGMGGVYEGEHLEIGRRVAVKVVSSHHARDPHIAARIKQEARSTSAIESEHIVQVFDAGEDDDIGLFLVMELLKGEDLSETLARTPGKALPPLTALSIISQASQGLARAHAARIVHRDLKPANIFLCQRDDGSSLVKLVDFGIAKLLRDASNDQAGGLTRMGMVIGTPQYMSPEQAQGLPSVDHRTDIYSLGAVLFEVIAGRSPYAEMPTYEQTILQIMMKEAPRLSTVVPDVLPAVDQLCAEMMAHDPAARPQEMSEVRSRLQQAIAELGGVGAASDTTLGAARDASGGWRGSISGADDAASAAASRASKASVPGTQSAVAVDPQAPESHDLGSVAGLPRKRSGLFGVLAIAGVAVAGATFFFLRPSAPPASPRPATGVTAAAGYGLAQGAASAPPSTGSPPAAVVSAVPVTIATGAVPSASASAAPPLAGAASAAVTTLEGTKPATTSKPASAPKHKDSSSKPHKVGATDLAEEF